MITTVYKLALGTIGVERPATREKTELEKAQEELYHVQYRIKQAEIELFELEDDLRHVNHALEELDKLEESFKLQIKELEAL